MLSSNLLSIDRVHGRDEVRVAAEVLPATAGALEDEAEQTPLDAAAFAVRRRRVPIGVLGVLRLLGQSAV